MHFKNCIEIYKKLYCYQHCPLLITLVDLKNFPLLSHTTNQPLGQQSYVNIVMFYRKED